MPIQVNCPSCRASLNVKDGFAGKSGKCPKCGEIIQVPEPTPQPASGVAKPKSTGEGTPIPPATERQKEYARELGINFDDKINRRGISKLIDQAVKERDEQRLKSLEALQDRESAAYQQIREEVLREINEEDPRLPDATLDQIMTALADRELCAILITFDANKLDDYLEGAGSAELSFTKDLMTENNMRDLLGVIGVSISGVGDTLGKLHDLLDDED